MSGRGLVVRTSAFQADDVSSILTVRSKILRAWYMGCASVRQTEETCSSHVARSNLKEAAMRKNTLTEEPCF